MLTNLLLLLIPIPQGPVEPLSAAVRDLPNLGIQVRDERALDRSTGRIIRTTTDASTGEPVNADRLLVEEGRARDSNNSKLSHELVAKLVTETQPFEVVFWLRRKAGHADLRAKLNSALARDENPADARRTALSIAAAENQPLTAAFVDLLRADGYAPTYVDSYVPIVFVSLPPNAIRTFAALRMVDQAYYSFPEWAPEEGLPAPVNEWASPSARTDYVHRRGIDGAGVSVFVNDTANVATNNPYLPPITTGNSASVASHATGVAGIICSSHPTSTGAAPGLIRIGSYGASGDSGAPLAWSWGMQQGISFGNCSWWNFNRGSIVFLDRYFDYIIRNFGVMMFKSCGNQGNGNPTTTPGNGFNMTSTGNAEDRDSHDWDDDIMRSSSSTGNPMPSNHEKPEVTAHGTAINSTTTRSPWIGSIGSGTSFASPVTLGTAALLAQTDSLLKTTPELVKACIMAGAWNNIHGASPVSDWDGVGAIDAAASQSAVAKRQYVSTTVDSSSFPGGVWTATMPLLAGDTTRVVAVWFSNANQAATVDVLEMDVDMTVEAPSGAVVAASASANNPFEIVEFTPAETGVHTIKLHLQRFLGVSEPLAIAWNTSQNAATNQVAIVGTPRLGQTVTFEFFDRYHPGSVYFAPLSLTPAPATWQVPGGKLIPMGFDALSEASVNLTSFVGAVPAGGTATAQLMIPPAPALVGMSFECAMVTLQANKPEAEETSDVVGFTVVQ